MAKTLKQFVDNCSACTHIPAALIRAVVRQTGTWSSFKEIAQDVANHGANGGYSGFIYYSDTEAFFKKNKADIMELAKGQASDFGMETLSMIAGFNCLRLSENVEAVADAIYNPHTDDNEKVRNALAWYALEEVSRAYVDFLEDN